MYRNNSSNNSSNNRTSYKRKSTSNERTTLNNRQRITRTITNSRNGSPVSDDGKTKEDEERERRRNKQRKRFQQIIESGNMKRKGITLSPNTIRRKRTDSGASSSGIEHEQWEEHFISSDDAPFVIGRGGYMIEKLQDDSNTFMYVDDSEKSSGECIVIVRGKERNRRKAIIGVENLLEEKRKRNQNNKQTLKKNEIPCNHEKEDGYCNYQKCGYLHKLKKQTSRKSKY